jgi:hypothetical protein
MNKLIAWLLILMAVLMILGMVINIHVLWFVIDILVILGCLFSGIFLLLEKKG